MHYYDPYAQRIATPGPFSFAIPNEVLSRRDRWAIKRAAKGERPRYLRLLPGDLSPVQRRYQESCNSGRLEVRRQRVAYAKAVGDALVAAQRDAALAAIDPPALPSPAGLPPAAGVERTVWLTEMRRSVANEAERERRRAAAAAADAALTACELDIEAIDHLAAVAMEAWARFAQTLFELHSDILLGRNNTNPTLSLVRFTALQDPPALEPLDFRPRRAEVSAAIAAAGEPVPTDPEAELNNQDETEPNNHNEEEHDV